MISGSDLHVYMNSHFLIMSVELQVFFLLIQWIPVNLTHYTVTVRTQGDTNAAIIRRCPHLNTVLLSHDEPPGYLSLHTGGSPLYPRFLRLSSCFSVIPYCSRFFSKFPRACTITLVVFFTAKLEINMSQKL